MNTSTPERLPELGQVWGNLTAFETFKARLCTLSPNHWETFSTWTQANTRDRGYVLELPEGKMLDALLAGEPQLLALTIVYGNPEAVAAQMQYGPESYLYGGWLIALGDRLELSTHT